MAITASICWTPEGAACIIKGIVAEEVSVELSLALPLGAAIGGMERFWAAGPEQIVLWFAVLAILLAVTVYVLGKIRPKPLQNEPRASQWLSKFRELHSRGGLSDEEYRTIKTTLASELQEELKDNEEKS